MGILNVTPDSFYDGGQLYRDKRVDVDAVLRRAEEMWRDGAAILDVGGESTRPGAQQVSESEELDRVGCCGGNRQRLDIIISVDSSNPTVMTESARLGAGLLNDVRGFSRGALEAAADSGLAVCDAHAGAAGHHAGEPDYVDLIADINEFFEERVRTLGLAGVSRDRIILDPGFGFGNRRAQFPHAGSTE